MGYLMALWCMFFMRLLVVDLGMLMLLNLFMKCSCMASLTHECDGCEGVNSLVVVSLGVY